MGHACHGPCLPQDMWTQNVLTQDVSATGRTRHGTCLHRVRLPSRLKGEMEPGDVPYWVVVFFPGVNSLLTSPSKSARAVGSPRPTQPRSEWPHAVI